MSKLLGILALLCLCIGVVNAQVAKPGDYIIASYASPDAVYAVTPNTNVFSTVGTVPTSNKIRGVMVGADNTNYYIAAGLSVFQMTPAGVVTTILTRLPMGVGSCWNDLDENGQILVGTGWAGSGGLFRLDPVSLSLHTLRSGIFPNVFCLDRDTGDIVAGEYGSSYVFRIKRDGTVNTVVPTLRSPYSMDFHPETNEVLIGSIYRLDALNTLTTFVSGTSTPKALAVLSDGNVAAGPHGTTILLFDRNGKQIGIPYNGPTMTKLCMVVEDEHNLWGIDTPTPGGVFNIRIRFANHPGKAYVAAASFSPRPGIPVDSRTIPLTPDNLFAASVVIPQVFVNFRGTLDLNGRASPYIPIPNAGVLKGLRFFLAAVVVDPAAPSSIAQISQEYGVTIQ